MPHFKLSPQDLPFPLFHAIVLILALALLAFLIFSRRKEYGTKWRTGLFLIPLIPTVLAAVVLEEYWRMRSLHPEFMLSIRGTFNSALFRGDLLRTPWKGASIELRSKDRTSSVFFWVEKSVPPLLEKGKCYRIDFIPGHGPLSVALAPEKIEDVRLDVHNDHLVVGILGLPEAECE